MSNLLSVIGCSAALAGRSFYRPSGLAEMSRKVFSPKIIIYILYMTSHCKFKHNWRPKSVIIVYLKNIYLKKEKPKKPGGRRPSALYRPAATAANAFNSCITHLFYLGPLTYHSLHVKISVEYDFTPLDHAYMSCRNWLYNGTLLHSFVLFINRFIHVH